MPSFPQTKTPLYLHVGVHRTATSSIQAFMQENNDELARQGFCLANGRGRQRILVNKFYSGEIRAADLAKQLDQFSHETGGRCLGMIISDEDIAKRKEVSVWSALSELFDVKVVIALRRQDLWLESWYLQNIKWQWDEDLAHLRFDEFLNLSESFHWIDYDCYVRRWEKAFGSDKILPFVFERDQMPKGPVRAFADLVGFSTDRMSAPPHRNFSFSPLMAEFVRQLPLDTATAKRRAQFEKVFFQVDKMMEKSPSETSQILLPPADRKRILERYESGNQAVARRYFDRDKLFFDPLPARDASLGALELPADSKELMRRVVVPVIRELINLGKEPQREP